MLVRVARMAVLKSGLVDEGVERWQANEEFQRGGDNQLARDTDSAEPDAHLVCLRGSAHVCTCVWGA